MSLDIRGIAMSYHAFLLRAILFTFGLEIYLRFGQ